MTKEKPGLGQHFRGALKRAEEILMPQGGVCVICRDPRRAETETGICPDCMRQLLEERVPAGACPKCLSRMSAKKGCAFCQSGGLKGFSGAFAPFWYHPCSRRLVIAVKFGFNDEPARFLGARMCETLTDREYDMIVPVPLHKRRQRYRGVNQAALLAEEVSRGTGIPLREDVLFRVRATRPQTSMSGKTQRKSNVKNAFRAEGEALKGARVLLCDDVRTSGATARACREALEEAGCVKVGLITACCKP